MIETSGFKNVYRFIFPQAIFVLYLLYSDFQNDVEVSINVIVSNQSSSHFFLAMILRESAPVLGLSTQIILSHKCHSQETAETLGLMFQLAPGASGNVISLGPAGSRTFSVSNHLTYLFSVFLNHFNFGFHVGGVIGEGKASKLLIACRSKWVADARYLIFCFVKNALRNIQCL